MTMTRFRGPLTVTAAVALFLLTACARDTADGPAAASDVPAGAPAAADDAPVIRVKQEGGFVPADRLVGRIPRVSVYADGRLIVEGPQIAIYPGPALPNLQVVQLEKAKLDQLVEQAVAAGVGSGADLGRPGVADVPATVIEVRTADGVKTTSAEALNEAMPDDPQLTEAQRQARAKLAGYVEQLTDLSQTASKPYQAQTLAALTMPWVASGEGEQPVATDWPGPALPGEPMSDGVKMGCVTVTGAELDKVLAAGAKANQNTPWTSGGKQYSLTFRPLLPDETGCADLKAAR